MLSETGAFTSAQLPPGRYFIRTLVPAAMPSGWMVESIMANGQDVSDVAVDVGSNDISDVVIRFTDRVSQLSGMVRSGERQPDASASVIVFPASRTLWTDYTAPSRKLRISRASGIGAFTFASMPPGDYLAAAISDADAGGFPNPKFLEKLAALATRVTIDRGQSKTQDLTTVSVR